MRLIAFTGLPRSGKDTAAYFLEIGQYERMSFAEPIKSAAAILLNRTVGECNGDDGFDREAVMPEWGFTMRDFLQRFGTECMRNNFGQDFWIKHIRQKLDLRRDSQVAITDCRFENEAALVREFGGLVVEIRRPNLIKSAHASDAGVVPDIVLDNSGTIAEFAQKVGQLMIEYHAAVKSRPAAKSE